MYLLSSEAIFLLVRSFDPRGSFGASFGAFGLIHSQDDAPDTASGTTASYFPYLEELPGINCHNLGLSYMGVSIPPNGWSIRGNPI